MLLLARISPDWKVLPPKNIGERNTRNKRRIIRIEDSR
jgi:hypothetical protein